MVATQQERIPVKLKHNFLFLVDCTKAAARTEPGKEGITTKPVWRDTARYTSHE